MSNKNVAGCKIEYMIAC